MKGKTFEQCTICMEDIVYYAIGECGGAMEVSRCPECGAPIGGQNHALIDSNRQAANFVGEARPAWDPNNE